MARRIVGIALSLSAWLLATVAGTGSAQTVSPGPTAREPEITAAGHGETHLAPTFAVVMIGVTTRAGTAEAVKQARADAAVLASAAGGTLGRLITLSSSSSMPPGHGPYQLDALLSSASSVPTVVSPRELTISAQALGRWEFIPGPS